MLSDEYVSMKELAVICGSTQKRIGLALQGLSLWSVGGGPTPKARREGYVGLRYYPNHEDYPLSVWHKERALAVLKTVGISPLPTFTVPPPVPNPEPQDEKDRDSDSEEDDEVGVEYNRDEEVED